MRYVVEITAKSFKRMFKKKKREKSGAKDADIINAHARSIVYGLLEVLFP